MGRWNPKSFLSWVCLLSAMSDDSRVSEAIVLLESSRGAAWLREIDACFGRLGGLLERQLSLINPLARVDALPWHPGALAPCAIRQFLHNLLQDDDGRGDSVLRPFLFSACSGLRDSVVAELVSALSCIALLQSPQQHHLLVQKRVGVAVFRGAFLRSSLFPSSPSRCSHSHRLPQPAPTGF